MNTASTQRRPRTTAIAWLLFVMVCAVFAAVEWGTYSARERVEAGEIEDGRRAVLLESAIRNFAVRDAIPNLEAKYNDWHPFPRQILDLPQGRVERILVPGERIDPSCAGWAVRIDYSVVPGAFWNRVRALPPARSASLADWLGGDAVREHVEQLRRLTLILCGVIWAIAIVLIPIAGPSRRPVAQVAIAATLLALLAWAADPDRTGLWSLPERNWIFRVSIGALILALFALLVPSRRRTLPGGRCACGYDLTGNVSGVCPECGEPTPAERHRRRAAELAPLAQAIEQTEVEPADSSEDEDALATE